MSYTERFTETHASLATIFPASYNSEQNTAWIDCEGYHRIYIDLVAGDIGTSVDMDIEVSLTDGGTPVTLKSITQLTQAGGDDNSYVGVEVRMEEMAASNYKFLRVELTPSGSCLLCVRVWGVVARYNPADVTGFDEIVD